LKTIKELTKEELKKLIGPSRRKLIGEEYKEIKLILKLLEPYDYGHSLHCWDEKYRYNGKIYQITGEFSSPNADPIIEELDS
jgi:hypothetical protein